jgi:UDP-N-acetylmuramoyl-L-alanyl-D-glutamate--2,6-diaminopimelate ligase
VSVEPDRRRAIGAAVGTATDGDVVVIAGKGHEQGQTFADRTVPFSDVDEARDALRRLASGTHA